MPTLSCPHSEAIETGQVCSHLPGTQRGPYVKWFSGVGLEYHLICRACAKQLPEANIPMRTVCKACFKDIERQNYWDGITGQPEVLNRLAPLAFSHRQMQLPGVEPASLLDIQPLDHVSECAWIALTTDGTLSQMDFDNGVATAIANVSSSAIDLKQPVSLCVAPDGSYAAVTNTFGMEGSVFDLSTGEPTMRLQRGPEDDSEHTVTPFPVAFFRHQGRLLLVHLSDWNRLDIADPMSGELLTTRGPTSYRQGEKKPEHYLDYFHGRLFVSPNQEWIVDDCWIWHPLGDVTSWSISRWLEKNVWESEDGESRQDLFVRAYFWGGPICWIDGHTLAVWGYGCDVNLLIPAACLFDVRSGEMLRWFPGVLVTHGNPSLNEFQAKPGLFVFDKYLFACSDKLGISVWEVGDGACLHRDPSFSPVGYHRRSRQFLSVLPESGFRISQLVEQDELTRGTR